MLRLTSEIVGISRGGGVKEPQDVGGVTYLDLFQRAECFFRSRSNASEGRSFGLALEIECQ